MANLSKENIIAAMVEREPGLSKAAAGRILKAQTDLMKKTIAEGGRVAIAGFGTFVAVDTKARVASNPRTGEKVDVPAGRRVKFKAGKELKEML